MKKITQSVVADTPFPAGVSVSEQQHIVQELDALQAQVLELTKLQSDTAAELDALLPAVLEDIFGGQDEASVAA
jgi:hypothetical protein